MMFFPRAVVRQQAAGAWFNREIPNSFDDGGGGARFDYFFDALADGWRI